MMRSKPKPVIIDSLKSDDDDVIRIGDKLYSRKAYNEAMANARKELIEKRKQGITFLGKQEHPDSAVGEELGTRYKHYPYQTPISSLPPISEEDHKHNVDIACRMLEFDEMNKNKTIYLEEALKNKP